MSFVQEHGRQCMPCSVKFSMTLQTEIRTIETSDFLKQIIEKFSQVRITVIIMLKQRLRLACECLCLVICNIYLVCTGTK